MKVVNFMKIVLKFSYTKEGYPLEEVKGMAIKENKDYYTAAQVKQILGITDGMLYNYIDNGALQRIIPPGKKQGVYKRQEVDRLARELQSFIIQRRRQPTKLMRVTTEEEMAECMEISQALFGVGRDTVKARMQIVAINPDTYTLLRDDSQIIGYFAAIPVKLGRLDDILAQELPVKIAPDDIAKYERGAKVDLWLHAIGVRPGFSVAEKYAYGSRLLAGLIELIVSLGERGVVVNTIAARSNTPDGVRLLRHSGFTEIPPLTPERRTFIIDVEGSGIPFILQYKRNLEKSLEVGVQDITPKKPRISRKKAEVG